MDHLVAFNVAGEVGASGEALIQRNPASGAGARAPVSTESGSLSSGRTNNAILGRTLEYLFRKTTIIERRALITVLVIVILILSISFGVSKAQHLFGERVQTIYVQSKVEQGMVPQTPGRHPCDDGWIRYRNKCYYFSEVEGNWTVANDSCAALYSFLAVIDNQLELDFMIRQKGISDRWIGLKKDSDGTWKWYNGTPFNNWFKVKDFSDCAFLNYHPIRSGECSNRRKWICSKVLSYKRRRKKRSPELKTQFLKEHFPKT